jgi:hypothetical protein
MATLLRAEDAPEENVSPSAAAVRRQKAKSEPLKKTAAENRLKPRTVADRAVEHSAEGCRTALRGLCRRPGHDTAGAAFGLRYHRSWNAKSLPVVRMTYLRQRYRPRDSPANRRNLPSPFARKMMRRRARRLRTPHTNSIEIGG